MPKPTNTAARAEAGHRSRGRPARLSRQLIIDRALELLESRAVEELTLSAVADELSVATMSLYKYFANRDALLEAVVEHSFSTLRLPQPGPSWQDYLLEWCWRVQRHFDRYPIARKVLGWEGRVPAAWRQVHAPVITLLQDLGLKGDALAFASAWFLSSTTGFMLVESVAPEYRRNPSLGSLDGLPTEVQQTLLALRPHLPGIDRERLLEFGFRQLIQSLEALLPSSARPGRQQRR